MTLNELISLPVTVAIIAAVVTGVINWTLLTRTIKSESRRIIETHNLQLKLKSPEYFFDVKKSAYLDFLHYTYLISFKLLIESSSYENDMQLSSDFLRMYSALRLVAPTPILDKAKDITSLMNTITPKSPEEKPADPSLFNSSFRELRDELIALMREDLMSHFDL